MRSTVSPLRLNELNVGLCPDRLVVARFRRGVRRTLAGYSVLPVKADPVGALKELAGGSRLNVVLSNHFVRYALLPWSSTLASAQEWTAFARHCFAATYGEAAAGWDMRVCPGGRGNAALACAVDRELVESLRGIPGLVSLQPHVMAAFNARRAALPAAPLWFVLQERGRVTLGLIRDGGWKLIRNRQAPENWRESLADLLDRESAAFAGAGADCAAVCAEDELPQRAGRYRLLDLTLPPHADPALRAVRMALAA